MKSIHPQTEKGRSTLAKESATATNQTPSKEMIDMNKTTFSPGDRVEHDATGTLGTIQSTNNISAVIDWDEGSAYTPGDILPIEDLLHAHKFPIGSTVVMNQEVCPFDNVEGTGTVVAMPDSRQLDHYPALGFVAVRWHDQERYPGTSAPYDPDFLKAVMTFEQWNEAAEDLDPALDATAVEQFKATGWESSPVGLEAFTDIQLHEELARRKYDHEAAQMTAWLAKPVGHHASKCEWTHRVICAIQIVRTQEPAYSINRLAMITEIPISILKGRLNGRGVITVQDVCRISTAMDVPIMDILTLSEKGETK